MSNRLTLHELILSPNNVKARIALGYKGLEYEREALEFNELDKFPGNRSRVVQLSRSSALATKRSGRGRAALRTKASM